MTRTSVGTRRLRFLLIPAVWLGMETGVLAGCGPSAPDANFTPAVAGLPPPPEGVLTGQRALASLPRGFVRTEDGRIYGEKDGAEVVLIPEGEYLMAREDFRTARRLPLEPVFISRFLVDRHEVTNGQFARFVTETGFKTDAEKEMRGGTAKDGTASSDWRHPSGPASSITGLDTHPVAWMSWNDAKAYCDWAGRRLPTEAEFEKVLRGGLKAMKYPWGNDAPSEGTPGNYAGAKQVSRVDRPVRSDYEDGHERSAPVGSFPQNALGLFDVSGNVGEWCSDWYDQNYFGSPAFQKRDPQGPSSGAMKVGRGGSWDSPPSLLLCSMRQHGEPTVRSQTTGFRCARSVP